MADKISKELPIGVSSSGSDIYIPVEYTYSEDAKCMVPIDGKPVDMYKMIQASINSTDIAAIVKRATAGDVSVLHVNQAVYADVSEVPTNLNDINALNIEALNGWSKLDPNIKKLFNNNYSDFNKAVLDGSYVNIINEALTANDSVKKDGEE